MPESIHDVAIVGCGPVGLTLALHLGRAGHDVVVVDKYPERFPLPRAVVCDHEARRIYQSAGVGEAISRISAAVPDWYEWHNQHGETLVKIKWWGDGLSGWPETSFYSQPEVEGVLEDAAVALPTVSVRRGLEAVRIEESADDVELTLTDPDAGEHRIRARYVIGADGSNSFVREQMDTSVTDLGFYFDWLIVDVVEDEPRTWSPMNLQVCDPARPHTIVAGGPGRRRWEFMRLPGESIDELNTAETAWRLLEPWGLTPDNAELERHTVYTFQARWADRWRRGRLLLAGDAAHLMPPFAGQGLCSGLRDTANLAWKLDLVLRDVAGEALLDTYTSERSDHVQHAIQTSIALGRVICVTDTAEAAERDQRMITTGGDPATALPPLPPAMLGPGATSSSQSAANMMAGHLFPQFTVTRAGRTGRFDDVVGTGFHILATVDTTALLSREQRRFLRDLGAKLVHVVADGTVPGTDGAEGSVTDTTGACLALLSDHGAQVVVVRPDFYVYGARAQAEELGGLLDELKRSIGAPATLDEHSVLQEA
ncbi:bifunctional 3-(3-hydroxy-phenyl)propionate/3-hydroxycinnamic acid hydroxylase [Streptomyces sp. NPDC003247]|uniref:bifunctional 3-(3-hydroxy-phenyl)propionate/3-hydroxycinnamic acid hydroxylase MhpA n=1 Tax=Streptomyces sp. NPDC003247 TaxID=3364677 RepID=UPI00369B0AF7